MMKINKAMVGFALICLLCMMLASCANGKQAYTYASASEEVQKKVDFILSKESVWDRGGNLGISFLSNGNFKTTIHQYSYVRKNEWWDLETEYEYDAARNIFKEVSEEKIYYVQVEGSLKYTNLWESGWSTDRKRDYLTQKFMERKT